MKQVIEIKRAELKEPTPTEDKAFWKSNAECQKEWLLAAIEARNKRLLISK